jgi:toxin YoeB
MRTIVFSPDALRQLDEWKKTHPKIAIKIVALITSISETPFSGIGKPEPLKFDLKGKWSRRISHEHRLVYEVTDQEIKILSCRFHYD